MVGRHPQHYCEIYRARHEAIIYLKLRVGRGYLLFGRDSGSYEQMNLQGQRVQINLEIDDDVVRCPPPLSKSMGACDRVLFWE